jgi:proteasome accessory factor B
MPHEDAAEPLERLLNLVALLLETDRPLTFEQIRETLEAYQGENVDSAKRKFERDKDILREYGVPLEMKATDVWDVEQGYLIPRDEYYLPEIAFTPEEITALFVAAQSGREETAAAAGVRKLVYGTEGGVLAGLAGGPLVSGSDAASDRVMAAADAAADHRKVRFGYRTAQGAVGERIVDVFGVVCRGGHWYLVGHDDEREEIRAFRLSRVTTTLEDTGEGSEPPEGFRASDHVDAGPWQALTGERARVVFTPPAAVLARSTFTSVDAEETLGDGREVLSIPMADEATLAPVILEFGAEAEVVDPPSLRNEVVARLEWILAS